MTAVSNPLLDMARLEELNKLVRQEKAVAELLEVMNSNFTWLIRFCEANRIEIPDKERLCESAERISALLHELQSDESYHRDDSNGELPEPPPDTVQISSPPGMHLTP